MTMLVEAAVETLEGALAAAEGGADRIELCADLANGGTTPEIDLLRSVRSQLEIPVFVLIRPRAGDFVYTPAEHRTMLEQIGQAKDAGAHGIVSGSLTDHQTFDLVEAAHPLPFTFHRAFDEYVDQATKLEQLIALGVDRVLTSGGAPTAAEGAGQIRRLVVQARDRITVLAGGGIDASNVFNLVLETEVREVHFSVRGAEKVRKVKLAML